MTRIRLNILPLLVCMILVSAAACRTSSENVQAMILPSAELSPVDVVRIQLAGLKENGPSNDGISQAFEFASPANRLSTGPLERFATLFEGPLYSGMVNHRRSEVLPPFIENDLAIVPVKLVAADGTEWRYLFVLSRQRASPYENMWMTDAVQLESQPPRQLLPLAPQLII